MGSLLDNLKGGRTAKPTSRGKASGGGRGKAKTGAKSFVKKKAAKGKGPRRP